MRRVSIMVMAVLTFVASVARAEVEIYPAPARATPSPVYHVSVNGRAVFAEKFNDVHYAHFSSTGAVRVTVTVGEPIRSYLIQPRAAAPTAEQTEKTLTFTLDRPRQLVVTVNDAERLFIFADEIDPKAPSAGAPGVRSVLDFEVDPTGSRVETTRIQQAIDRTASAGEVLYFPAGTYLTGTLALKSNATVYLAGGATLLGSPNRDDYPVDAGFKESDMKNDPEHWSNKGAEMTYSRLLLIDGAKNVRLAGRGVVDGQGKLIRGQGKPANLLRIRNASNVTVEGLILRDAAAWNTHVLYSDHVAIRNVKVVNDRSVLNSDGIDPDSAQDLLVERCFLYTGDDGFALKTSGNSKLLRNAERIVIRGCVILSKKSAMKLGTETFADFQRDIAFEDNDVVESDRAMSLYSADGAKFENIRWINDRIEATYPDNQRRTLLFSVKGRGTAAAGYIHDVLIQDVTVNTASPNPLLMEGSDDQHDIRGVRFVNFSVGGRRCSDAASARLECKNFVRDVTFAAEAKPVKAPSAPSFNP